MISLFYYPYKFSPYLSIRYREDHAGVQYVDGQLFFAASAHTSHSLSHGLFSDFSSLFGFNLYHTQNI